MSQSLPGYYRDLTLQLTYTIPDGVQEVGSPPQGSARPAAGHALSSWGCGEEEDGGSSISMSHVQSSRGMAPRKAKYHTRFGSCLLLRKSI